MARTELEMLPPPETTACCAACAADRPASTQPASHQGPIVTIPIDAPGGRPVRRDDDRRIALGSIVLAGAFVTAAGVAAIPGADTWVPLHLLLAGAAATAIAGVLPFFASALATSRPIDPRVRATAVGLVAVGAVGVAVRTTGVAGWVPVGGGMAFVTGAALVAGMTIVAARAGLAARRPWVTLAYGAALANLLAGATIGTLFVAGVDPVVGSWSALRPAHAWLNLVGFVSLVVVGTLLHLLPTVAGTRIVDRVTGRVAVGGLAVGVPLIAGGLLVAGFSAAGGGAGDLTVRAGAVLVLVAAAAIVAEAAAVLRARGRWTTDPGWHAVAVWSLAAGTGWCGVGLGLAAVRVLDVGPGPDAWLTPLVAAPLAIGWVVQVLVGAWTHLIPAIGPGGPAGHAVRRVVLGRGGVGRLAAFNGGVVLLTASWALSVDGVAAAGGVLVGAAMIANLVLAIAAVVGRRGGPARSGAVVRAV